MKKTQKAFLYSVTLVLVLISISGSSALAQYQVDSTIQTTFFNPPAPIRQPGEFEPMQGALIRYSTGDGFGISYEIIAEMAADVNVVTIVASVSEKNTVQSLYQSHGINLGHCSYLIAPSNTWWTRDYGPWFIINGNNEQGVVDFTYNRPRPYDDAIPGAYASNQSLPLYFMPLVHSGGNYMTDGQGIAISTTLTWEENPGYTHDQINQMVHDYLGITTYHVVPDVNGDYIKHIDCWGKYLSPDTILIRQVPPSNSQYNEIEAAVGYFENQTSCYGTPYHVVRVYTPNGEPYTNSLILNNKVFVPIMGDQWDDDAIQSYQNAMPGYEILGFTGSWVSTDALHCRAMGITDRYMLYIEHTPLLNQTYNPQGYDILAKIHPYSNQNLVSGSPMVYYRTSDDQWHALPMQSLGDDQYKATIPAKPGGSTVQYYINAQDESGRSENHPYIGAPGAHTFTISGIPPNTPPEKPDKPTGTLSGKVKTVYTYSTKTTDPDGDNVSYAWDWGDGTTSEWLGPFNSGVTMSVNHSWDKKGTYQIRVRAKDTIGAESNWSDPLSVTMPQNNNYMFSFFENIRLFLEQWFPRLFLLLTHMRLGS